MGCTAGSRNGHLTAAGRHGPVRWLSKVIGAMGDRLFRRDDQWAIDHSWQITKRHGGLSRRYRDPRFDTLRACPRCGGSGGYPDEPCATCDGIGRVRQVASSPEGQLR